MNYSSPSPLRRTIAWIIPLFMAAVLFGGCSKRNPYVSSLQTPRKVAVLDLKISEKIRETPRSIDGWWLGSRDMYRAQNVGRRVGDEIARTITEIPYVDLFSRLDYQFYISGKRKLLEANFKGGGDVDYEDFDYDRMIERIDPVAIGKDLNVDYVVAGEVKDAYISHNRAIHWLWSRVDVSIEVYDVRAGEKVASFAIEEKKHLASSLRLIRQELEELLPEFDRAFSQRASTEKKVAE